MKVLHLALKKKWFNMTDFGEKSEDYREINEYWISRLCRHNSYGHFKSFDQVFARNGYNPKNRSWTRKFLGIEMREGRPEWGAEPGKKYFVIKLGEKI
jgi:hypothetical protein